MTNDQFQQLLDRKEEIEQTALEAAGFTDLVRELRECSETAWNLFYGADEKLPLMKSRRLQVSGLFSDVIDGLLDKAMQSAGTYDEWCNLSDQECKV